MSEILINQSMIKDLIRYQKGELCGLIFQNKWILQQFGKGTKSNNLGHYFEYLCTGALAKGETNPPKPEYTKKGELSSDYVIAKEQAEYFHSLRNKFGFKIDTAGEKVIADNQWVGTLDIKASWSSVFKQFPELLSELNPNHYVIIDLKFSGLLEDKFNPLGWHTDTLPRKEGTIMQAKHYKFLFWKKYGFNPPFFFFVFDSKVVGNAKLLFVDISEYDLIQYEQFLYKAKAYLKKVLDEGLKPIPKYSSCIKCAYNSWCIFKEELPPIITIKPE